MIVKSHNSEDTKTNQYLTFWDDWFTMIVNANYMHLHIANVFMKKRFAWPLCYIRRYAVHYWQGFKQAEIG